MLHPLEQKIIDVRRRARQLAAVYGLSAVATATLLAMFVIGSLDYLLRLEDRGLRILATAAIAGAIAWSLYRFLGRKLFAPLPDVNLALHVERQFPVVANRLASAVELLHRPSDEQTLGSPSLRKAFIAETAVRADGLDFRKVLDARRPIRAATLFTGVFLASLVLIALWPGVARIAIARLLNPFSDATWPRTTHLVIRQPLQQLARGQDFEIEVADRFGKRLPADLRIHYRNDGPDGVTFETHPLRQLGETTVARRDSVQFPFSYRVEGGDDHTMLWTDVPVLDPPAIESLSVQLTPPAYSGWPVQASGSDIRALRGTHAMITGRANTPLRSAHFCLDDGHRITAQLGDDGHIFSIGATDSSIPGNSFIIDKSGSYSIELVDRAGLTNGAATRWEIVTLPDTKPTVRLDQPSRDLFVTPQAVIHATVVASDDIALRNVTLQFRNEETAPEASLPLFTGPKQPPPSSPNSSPATRTLKFQWPLAALHLQPGMQVIFRVAASDYASQVGTSTPRRLVVVTSDEFQEHVARLQKSIRMELQKVAEFQRRLRVQVATLARRVAENPGTQQTAVDELLALLHGQREIHRLLSDAAQGVPMRLDTLRSELQSNPAEVPAEKRQMDQLSEQLDELWREHLLPAEQELSRSLKLMQAEPDSRTDAMPPANASAAATILPIAAQHQDAILNALERWIAALSRSDNYRSLAKLFAQLLFDQEQLNRRTAELGRRTLTRELADLSPQDIAALATEASRQVEIARTYEDWSQRMEQIVDARGTPVPTAATTIADALHAARRLAVNSQMRNASSQLERNQVGQALAAQKEIRQKLQTIWQVLANRAGKNGMPNGKHPTTSADTAPGDSPPNASESADGQPNADPSSAKKPGSSPGAAVQLEPAESEFPRLDKAATRERMERLWGQLPARAREQMLNTPAEDFPPEYESLIEAYFRRLADEPPR